MTKNTKSQKLAFLRRSANSRQNSANARYTLVTGIPSQNSTLPGPQCVSPRSVSLYLFKRYRELKKLGGWDAVGCEFGLSRARVYLIAKCQRPATAAMKLRVWLSRKKNFMRFVKRIVMPLLERKQTLSPSHTYTRGGVPAEAKW